MRTTCSEWAKPLMQACHRMRREHRPKVPQLSGKKWTSPGKKINEFRDKHIKQNVYRYHTDDNKNPKDNTLIQKSVIRTQKVQPVFLHYLSSILINLTNVSCSQTRCANKNSCACIRGKVTGYHKKKMLELVHLSLLLSMDRQAHPTNSPFRKSHIASHQQ